MEEDNNDYDYEAAKAAELKSICDQQFKTFMSQYDVYATTFAKLPPDVCNSISIQARQSRNYMSTTLSYGEMEFESFGSLICSLTKHGVDLGSMSTFVDLGSGVGKIVISAALLGIFEKCTGIEIISELHRTSASMLKRFYRHNQNNAEVVAIEFIAGDASFIDWSNADMVFAHATCFDAEIMTRLAETSCKMKDGSIFITISNRYYTHLSISITHLPLKRCMYTYQSDYLAMICLL
jgi:hypothetical protein